MIVTTSDGCILCSASLTGCVIAQLLTELQSLADSASSRHPVAPDCFHYTHILLLGVLTSKTYSPE